MALGDSNDGFCPYALTQTDHSHCKGTIEYAIFPLGQVGTVVTTPHSIHRTDNPKTLKPI